ncbi:MAG TPA: hypothetical protein VFE11_14845 [Dongiaceae bacterium]|nr:hypothetical protein [Dongiaceae bacterium]
MSVRFADLAASLGILSAGRHELDGCAAPIEFLASEGSEAGAPLPTMKDTP